MKKIESLRGNLAFNISGAIVLVLMLFGVLVSFLGFANFTEAFKREYEVTTYHMADTAATLVNGDHLDDYLAGGETEEYQRSKRNLDLYCKKINVSLVYVIDVDTGDYGSFVSVFNSVNNEVDDSSYTEWELGHERNTTNDEYRRKYRAIYEQGSPYETVYRLKPGDGAHPHITTLVPVKDSAGEVRAILCIQRPIREIREARRPYLRNIALSTILLALVSSTVAALFIRKQFVAPIQKVSDEATRFAKENTKGKPLGQISGFTEFANLARSIDTMETDMVSYIENLTAFTADKERIVTELSLAGKIQEASVPNEFPAFPEREDFDIFGMMDPAREVGGDFYNFYFVDDDHLALVIGDVSGKGIPAALFMMVTNILISDRTRMGGNPAEILRFVNQEICAHNEAEMFVTVWLGILELSTGKLVAANAGHEYPAIRHADGAFELLRDKHGFVIGGLEGVSYRGYELQLAPGDRIFVYTDGVPEATAPDNTMFGTDRMLAALNEVPTGSPEQILNKVRRAVDDFVKGAEQFDDLTMLCLEYKGAKAQEESPMPEKNKTELTLAAVLDNLDTVQGFVAETLERAGCPLRTQMQIEVAVEEIFVNIAQYAYAPETGEVTVSAELSGDGRALTLCFSDGGVPYDPLARQDPDIALPAEERDVGGLGVYMTKQLMDELHYEYRDGRNVLTMKKAF